MNTSNRKDFTPAIQAYILSVIDSEGFENCEYHNDCSTDKLKMKFLKGRFFSEYGWEVKRAGLQNAVRSWLQGLALDVDFNYCDIEKRLQSWGILEGKYSEKKLEKELDLYWDRLACNLAKMFNKVK